MFQRIFGIICILALTLLAGAAEVQAFTFSFPFPGSSDRDSRRPPGPGPWQYRPREPSNARGVPPSYQPPPAASGQMPPYQQPGYQQPGYQQPGYEAPGPSFQRGWPGMYQSPYGQQAARRTANPPRLELELSDHQPYVQENVLLKLRVVSDQNLETATPELPNSNDVLFQKVQGPKAISRSGPQGGREIVNEFVYTLTPLRAGNIEVSPLRVTGASYASGYPYGQSSGRRFEATSPESIRLQVRPAMASVRPWLPLRDLSLNATLDGGEEVEQGQPVTLTLELAAVGATGSQLPSLESLLRSPDFRVYREQTLNEGHLSSDGRRLEGRRTEYYTLVPRTGGRLQLPEIRLAWWNVVTGTKEYATLPVHTLRVDGESAPFGLSPSVETTAGGGLSWVWLPLAGVALLLLGYWGGVWYKGRPLKEFSGKGGADGWRERLASGLGRAAAAASAGLAKLAKKLSPAPLLGAIRPRLRRSLPASTRFLSCVRTANHEEDPAIWAERFQDLTYRDLQFESQTPLLGITGKILALRPAADPEQLRRLMQQLDGALYGNQDIDFARWKKQFRGQIGRRRGLAHSSGKRLHLIRARLPALNPQTS
jgi:hypothetical protein